MQASAASSCIGDAKAPAPIAWATYAGHRYAEELDAPDIGDAVPFRRELAALSAAVSDGRLLSLQGLHL